MMTLGKDRLRVVSNYGDGDCGAGEIHTRAKDRGDATRRERRKLLARRVSSKFRGRVCISSAPQSPSPKLETTRSLGKDGMLGKDGNGLKLEKNRPIFFKF